MSNLRIKDFGPINLVEIEIRRYNVVIGPQSSGKSCILKIASFCKWVENLICSNQYADIEDDMFVQKQLIDFYKLGGFVKNGISEIMYDSDFCKLYISFNNKGKIIYIAKTNSFSDAKVAYIPAERNIVSTIPNLLSLKLPNNELLSYITDWTNSKMNFDFGNPFPILNLGVSFYYDKTTEQDVLKMGDGDIQFSNASSGLQSVLPVCMLIDSYLHSKNKTAGEKADIKNMQKLLNSVQLPDDVISKIKDELKRREDEILPCHIFLEEPELSIFPETQYELVKWLVNNLNSNNNENSIFITTHSPYILTAFNNLIKASNVSSNKVDKLTIICKILNTDCFVDSSETEAFIIDKGVALSIMDSELHEIQAETIDKVSSKINNEYSQLDDLLYE